MTWCPFALRVDGPERKVGRMYDGQLVVSADKRGEVKHSMVGSYESAMDVLFSSTDSSWHFSVKKSGVLVQHYDTDAVTWHSAEVQNITHVGVEHEGGPIGNESEPLTEAQISTTTALTKWLAGVYGFGLYMRYPDQLGAWELTEHREIHATACPSGRIPWNEILTRLQQPPQEEEEMPPELIRRKGTTDTFRKEHGVYVKNPDKETREHYGNLFGVPKAMWRLRKVDEAALSWGKQQGFVKE